MDSLGCYYCKYRDYDEDDNVICNNPTSIYQGVPVDEDDECCDYQPEC